MSETVSVVIPAYNQSQYLAAAIRSALAQTYTNVDVVVIDDGSTDDTRAVATSFADERVRYIYQDNAGLAAARNTGIRNARGSLLTFLDSDDLFLPDKLAVLVGVLDDDPRLGLAAGEAILIDEHGEPLGEVFERGLPSDSTDLLLGNPLHVGSVVVRREWQERAGLFDETLRSYEDWDMWLRLARAGCPMRHVSRPVSLYRFHRAQMTRLGKQMTTATLAVLEKTFSDPALPPAWRARRDEAYSRAYLRAAAQAYTARDFSRARAYMHDAVGLAPELCANQGEAVARLVTGWANHAKTGDPLAFLAGVYDNLPDELQALRARRREELVRVALHLAFAAHQRNDAATARACIGQAALRNPLVLLNRGVLAVLLGQRLRERGEVAESPVPAQLSGGREGAAFGGKS